MSISILSKITTRMAGMFAAVMAIALAAAPAFAKTDLLIYTAVEADELAKFKKAIEQAVPDVEVKWVRDSTGIITSKLLAEKDNPKADVVWGIAATSLVMLANQGYFHGYAPKGLDKLDKRYYDTKNKDPLWVGQRVYAAAICANTVEMKKKNLPAPASWNDLTKPVYKGHVIMPNPNSSGTGFLDVSSWLQLWGEKDGWAYMDKLHDNIARYTHSGSAPCKLAASGEIPLGVSFAYRGVKSKQEGAPLDVVFPSEGLGWELEAFAIVNNTKKKNLAQKVSDWSVSRQAMDLYAPGYEAVAMLGVPNPTKELEGVSAKFAKNDFGWAADNRIRILNEWQKRYDAKSEPKK
ncbi:MAG: putative 2-aminoethylphosphonate ABC transporter substrate-binding protein [Alphaproteobacteria bacterium]|nr:putative 2-aminoethylphosphonate ABC transporter substrate-binding protein [Alphaproteobacteria bacterium]